MSIIKCENLGKRIKGNWVFENLNFNLNAGELYLVLGDNGSGKSVLLLTLLNIYKKNKGEIHYAKGAKNSISYSPYHLGLDEFLTVEENINYYVNNKLALRQQLDVWKLSGMKKKQAGRLSSGQRKRVSLARAFATDANLYLLDEPTTGLDQSFIGVLQNEVKDKLSQGKAMMIATHNPEVFQDYNPQTIQMRVH